MNISAGMDRQCKGVMVHRHRRRGKADTVKLSECPAVGVMIASIIGMTRSSAIVAFDL